VFISHIRKCNILRELSLYAALEFLNYYSFHCVAYRNDKGTANFCTIFDLVALIRLQDRAKRRKETRKERQRQEFWLHASLFGSQKIFPEQMLRHGKSAGQTWDLSM